MGMGCVSDTYIHILNHYRDQSESERKRIDGYTIHCTDSIQNANVKATLTQRIPTFTRLTLQIFEVKIFQFGFWCAHRNAGLITG